MERSRWFDTLLTAITKHHNDDVFKWLYCSTDHELANMNEYITNTQLLPVNTAIEVDNDVAIEILYRFGLYTPKLKNKRFKPPLERAVCGGKFNCTQMLLRLGESFDHVTPMVKDILPIKDKQLVKKCYMLAHATTVVASGFVVLEGCFSYDQRQSDEILKDRRSIYFVTSLVHLLLLEIDRAKYLRIIRISL
jgi:hypothetical protein